MHTIKEGVTFHAKLIYSNRFGDSVEITNTSDRSYTFDLTDDAKTELEKASTPAEVDLVVLALYGGKKGRR